MEAMTSTNGCSLSSPSDSPGAKDSPACWPEDICQACRAIFSGNYEGQTGEHHPSYSSLAQSLLEGCYICCYIWSQATKDGNLISEAAGVPYTEFTVKLGWHSESRNLEFRFPPSTLVVGFFIFPSSSVTKCDVKFHTPQALEISTNIGASTQSKDTWDLICSWLETCNPQSHPKCHREKPRSQLMPSRLLDVHDPEGVRLVSFLKSDKRTTKYTTLSHSWGHARILTLTHDTAPQLYGGIDESLLALSFRDAIKITRKLGIRYIWIDSLCIYQDDFSDWKSEASHMAEVYSGSYCNLAATAASDSSEGFFKKSNSHNALRRLVGARSIPASWASKENSDLIHPDTYHISIEDFWLEGMTKQPLLERGWVVQERMLAPRTIHFSQPQVFWECHHRLACETYPNRLPASAGVLRDLSMHWKEAHYKPPQPPSRYHRSDRPPLISVISYFLDDQPIDQWQALVESFSSCKLTMERDKLPAMSGIAKHIAKEGTRGRYFAGLWEKDFERQFLWCVLVKTEMIKRPTEYRAPSWSWASIDGKISQFTMPRGTIVNMTVVSVDRFPDELDQNLQDIRLNPRWYAKIKVPLHMAVITNLEEEITTKHHVKILDTQLILSSMVYWDFATPPKEAMAYILPIWYYVWHDEWPVVRGLVLKPVSVSESGQYERLGMFEMDFDSVNDLNIFLQGSQTLKPEGYEEHTYTKEAGKEQHLYTITLV